MGDSAKIAELTIMLKANTNSLDGALDKTGVSLNKFKTNVDTKTQSANAALSGVGSGISGAFQNALANPISAITGLLSKLGNALLHPLTTLKSAGSGLMSLFQSVGSGITSSISGVTGSLGGLLGGSGALAALMPILATGIGAVVVGVIALGAAVIGAGLALFAMGTKQIKVIADMEKMAMTLGMATEKFSAFASVGGQDAETFAGSMAKMERGISDAATGGGELADALTRVGLNARDLRNLSPEEQMRQIAGAMGNITNSADRLALSQKLFGKSGGFDMSRMLAGGTAGLDALEEKAKKFGLTFTQAQGEAALASEKKWKEWGLALTGLYRQVGIALVPLWNKISDVLSNVFQKISGWVMKAIPYITMFLDAAISLWDGLVEAFSPIGEFLGEVLGNFFSWVGDMITDSKDFFKAIKDIFKAGWLIVMELGSVVWEMMKTGWKLAVDIVTAIVTPFWERIKAGFFSILEALGMNMEGFVDWKTTILTILFTVEFAFLRWRDVISLMWLQLKLKGLEWLESHRQLAVTVAFIMNIMIGAWTLLGNTVVNSVNLIARAYNALMSATGQVSRMPIIPNIPAIRIEVPTLQELRTQINEVRDLVAEAIGDLGPDYAAFIAAKFEAIEEQLAAVNNATRQQGTNTGRVEPKENKALLKDSAEAFSIIAGQQGDKQYAALNDIIGELRQARRLSERQLAAMQGRINVAVARL